MKTGSATVTGADFAESRSQARGRTIACWIATTLIAAEFAVGGVMDILHLPPFAAVMQHLGYPA